MLDAIDPFLQNELVFEVTLKNTTECAKYHHHPYYFYFLGNKN